MNKKITHDLFGRFLLKPFICLVIMALAFNSNAATPIKIALNQAIQISGTVTDETNQPLPGVSVMIKNTNKGTSTDVSGKYSISAEPGAVLVFKFIGYLPQEVTVGDKAQINLKLTPQANMLNEVVAIGYQAIRKSEVVGAVASVKSSDLNLSSPSLGQALVGKVAGVQISQTGGAPYTSTKIRVRGVGSFNASSDPLYVIDGYPSNDIFINPEDIESIDVLKDAASAAIYGSRASGGVVLITTKKGKKGKGRFEYDVQTGIDQLAHKVKLLNADQAALLVIDGRNNAYHDLWVNTGHTWTDAMYSDNNATRVANVGNTGSVSIPDGLYNFASQTPIKQTVNTDWQDELYRNTFMQKHTLSFSGASDDIRYYISGSYQNQPGIIQSTGQQRYNFRANVDGDVSKRIHIGANIAYTQNTNQETQEGRFDHSPILGALIYMPYLPAYNADGSLATNAEAAGSTQYGYQGIENPLALAERIKINRQGYRSHYNANVTYNIMKGLDFKTNLGTETYTEKYDYYYPTTLSSGTFAPGSQQSILAANAQASNQNTLDRLAEFTLNYKKEIGKHHFDALGGYSAQRTTADYFSVKANGFQNDAIPEISNKGALAANFSLNSAYKSAYTLLSYFGRANYNYDGKYFLTASFRADGSSRFGPANKYGYFPSVAAGWNLSNEDFYNNFLGDQSTVKIRASWGKSGNFNIPNYAIQQTLATPSGTVLDGNSAVTATYPGGIKDNTLSWETTSQYNVGTDISLFKGRLSIIANYYLSYSYNLLYNQPISAISGSTTILTNLRDSKIRNTGFDLQLDGRIINDKDFTLGASGNISLNRNKVVKLPANNTLIINGAERSYLTSITTQGQPIGMFYGFKVGGIINADNLGKTAPSASQTNPAKIGDLWFVDTNHDGVVNDADKTIIGSPYAKFTYGFALNSTFKKFDLSAAFNGSYGNQILDGQDYYLYNGEGSGNQYANVADRYRNAQDPGDGSFYRASRAGTQSNSTRLSTFYLQSGSYLRCTNLTLGYTLPGFLQQTLGLTKARVFASVVNAFTITKYKGYNPDVDYNYSGAASNSTQPANLAPGIDYGTYPLVRSYNLGVNVTF
ncbi:SusC/RagA family TonB-linked outer membrane protein [Mucilaginibacter flavus]|uniref:SusC/RagA family TonB-linked outer membrane protein n=1 Tax=Mucilaginibacter flavus TaxID=931504 RepID=UPI0025B4A249|nr:TonB-dependent receptor [Mucilaginibacter flavus]MDN3583619.1 TonB-dependent receptor [Mucilaginibacter flavus]